MSDDVTSLLQRIEENQLPSFPVGHTPMKTLMTLVLWSLLFVLCAPLALVALILWPVVWIVSLPFRLLGIAFDAAFAVLRAVLFLPARLLGYREPAR